MNTQLTPSFTAFVGIDWADSEHDFCLQATGSDQRKSGTMDHSTEAIAKWAYSLRDRFGGSIAVCLELAKCPLVSALQRYEFLVLFPVHPSTLAKYRKAFVPAVPRTIRLMPKLLWIYCSGTLKLQSVAMRTLASLVEERRSLVNAVTGITNRLTSALEEYYPQVLDWFEHRDTLIFCDFLECWPTLKHVKRAPDLQGGTSERLLYCWQQTVSCELEGPQRDSRVISTSGGASAYFGHSIVQYAPIGIRT